MHKTISYYALMLCLALAAPSTPSRAAGTYASSISLNSTTSPLAITVGVVSIGLILAMSYYSYGLKQTNKTLNNTINTLNQNHRDHQNLQAELANRDLTINTLNAELLQEKQAYQKKHQLHQMHIGTYNTLMAEHTQLKTHLETLTKEIKTLNNTNNTLQNNINHLSNEETQRRIKTQNAKIIELQTQIRQLTPEKQSIKTQLNQAVNDFFTQNPDIKNKDMVIQRIGDTEKKNRELSYNLNVVKTQHANLAQEHENLTQQHETLKLTCKNLADEVNTLSVLNAELNTQNNLLRIENGVDTVYLLQ